MLASQCFNVSSHPSPLTTTIDRRYVQLELEEDQFKMPLDVILETLVGFALAIFATVLNYFSGMKDITYSAQFAGKTFEHFHTKRILRNLQKTRAFVFNSFLQKDGAKFPKVEDAAKNNSALKNLLAS